MTQVKFSRLPISQNLLYPMFSLLFPNTLYQIPHSTLIWLIMILQSSTFTSIREIHLDSNYSYTTYFTKCIVLKWWWGVLGLETHWRGKFGRPPLMCMSLTTIYNFASFKERHSNTMIPIDVTTESIKPNPLPNNGNPFLKFKRDSIVLLQMKFKSFLLQPQSGYL